MGHEKEHLDILQNFEAAVVQYWDEAPDLMDLHVIEAYELAARRLSRRASDQEFIPPSNTDKRVLALFGRLAAVSEWRLLQSIGDPSDIVDVPATELSVLVECLKQLRQSAKRWNREAGRQGYLKFISEFNPR